MLELADLSGAERVARNPERETAREPDRDGDLRSEGISEEKERILR